MSEFVSGGITKARCCELALNLREVRLSSREHEVALTKCWEWISNFC